MKILAVIGVVAIVGGLLWAYFRNRGGGGDRTGGGTWLGGGRPTKGPRVR